MMWWCDGVAFWKRVDAVAAEGGFVYGWAYQVFLSSVSVHLVFSSDDLIPPFFLFFSVCFVTEGFSTV